MSIKITHTGKVKNSLFISDISTIELREKGTAFPQYVPYKESVTLPLIDSVVLSLRSGALQGFLKAGLVTVTELGSEIPFGYEGPIEVWASTEGNDNNPGTKELPFRTIRKAMDVAYDVASWEHMKTVNIVSENGYFIETMLVNTPRWVFRGINIRGMDLFGAGGGQDGRVTLSSDPEGSFPAIWGGGTPTNMGYPLMIAPITQESYEEFLLAGGVDYSSGPVKTYSGASLETLDLHPVWISEVPANRTYLTFDVTFENLSFYSTGFLAGNVKKGPAIVSLAPPSQGPSGKVHRYLNEIIFKNGTASTGGKDEDPSLVLKNSAVDFAFFAIPVKGLTIFDNSGYNSLSDPPLQYSNEQRNAQLFFLTDANDPNGYPSIARDRPFGRFQLGTDNLFGSVTFQSNAAHSSAAFVNFTAKNLTTFNHTSINGTYSFTTAGDPLQTLYTKDLNHNSTGQMHIMELKAFGNITKTGTGVLAVQKTSVKGNVTISGGTSNTLADGAILGNLTVSNGANIDLTNVVVKGNVVLTGAGTVKWKGGSFYGTLTGTLIDPKTGLPYEPGDNINVG